jgi:CobW/HypB/UreG, nucleotide-binding domain
MRGKALKLPWWPALGADAKQDPRPVSIVLGSAFTKAAIDSDQIRPHYEKAIVEGLASPHVRPHFAGAVCRRRDDPRGPLHDAPRSAQARNVISLANGCVCRTIREDLLATVVAAIKRPERPEYILLVASGKNPPQQRSLSS